MQLPVDAHQKALTSLRRRWAFFAVACIAFLAGGYVTLSTWWATEYAARWLILPALAIVYLLAVLWRGLEANHRQNETQLLPALGWGNVLTLSRGVFVAAMLGFLFQPRPEGWLIWIPAILYTLSDAADFFDGYIARITHHATRLGEILDMSLDGLGVLAAASLGVQYGQLPAWYLSVAFARPAFLAGMWIRKRLGSPIYDLPPSIGRRVIAGFQMGFLAAALWPLLRPPGTHIAALFFGLPFLAGFIRDWLYITGFLKPSSKATSNSPRFLLNWLPIILRAFVLALITIFLSQWTRNTVASEPLLPALVFLEAAVGLLVVLGVSARVVSIIALVLLGLHQIFLSLVPTQIMLAAAYTGVLFLGSGDLSLWKPEEYLIYHRAGEQQPFKADKVMEHGQ